MSNSFFALLSKLQRGRCLIHVDTEGRSLKILHFLNHQSLKFLGVGLSNSIVSFVTFEASYRALESSPRRVFLAQAIGYSAGILWSFLWNRRFTFRTNGAMGGQLRRFVLLQASMLLATSILLSLAVDKLGLHRTMVWLVVMAIATVINFYLSKHWAFK